MSNHSSTNTKLEIVISVNTPKIIGMYEVSPQLLSSFFKIDIVFDHKVCKKGNLVNKQQSFDRPLKAFENSQISDSNHILSD